MCASRPYPFGYPCLFRTLCVWDVCNFMRLILLLLLASSAQGTPAGSAEPARSHQPASSAQGTPSGSAEPARSHQPAPSAKDASAGRAESVRSHQSREGRTTDQQPRPDWPDGRTRAAQASATLEAAVNAIVLASGPLRPSVRPCDDARYIVSVLCESSDRSRYTCHVPP